MTQYFVDDKGIKHAFPDDATPEEIDAATGGGGTSGGGDTTSPSEKTWSQHFLDNLSGIGKTSYNELRAFNRGLTLGGWDNLVGGIKSAFGAGSPAEERARTEEAKKNLILGGALPETAGTVASTLLTGGLAPEAAVGATGVRAVPNLATRIVARPVTRSVGTGAVQSGVQAEMDRKSPEEVFADMGIGGLLSGVTHGIGKGVRLATGYAPPKPPNTAKADLSNMTQDQWDEIKSFVYPRQTMHDVSQASLNDAKNTVTSIATGSPMTELNKGATKLFDKFNDRFEIVKPGKGITGTAGTPVWPKEVNDWRDAALGLEGDDAPYGQILADRLEHVMREGPTMKIAGLGQKAPQVTPELQDQYNESAYRGILAARDAAARTKAAIALDEASAAKTNTPIKQALRTQDMPAGVQEVLRQANKGTLASNTATRINEQGPNIIRGATAPLTGWLGLKGMPKEAIGAAVGGMGVAPAATAVTQPIADAARERMLQQMRDKLTGAMRPRPDTSVEDRFRQLLMSGWLSQQ